jgi:hypothetical protein
MDNSKLAQIYMAALQATVGEMCILTGDNDLDTFKDLIRIYTEKGLERVEANLDMYIMPPLSVRKACDK